MNELVMASSIPVVLVLRLIPSMVQFVFGEQGMISLIDDAPGEAPVEKKAAILFWEAVSGL